MSQFRKGDVVVLSAHGIEALCGKRRKLGADATGRIATRPRPGTVCAAVRWNNYPTKDPHRYHPDFLMNVSAQERGEV